MIEKLSRFIDDLSEFLAARKGLLPILGLALVAVNLIVVVLPGTGFLKESNFFLHVGVIVAIFGLMMARAL